MHLEAVVQGVVDALNASKEIEVLLVGDQKQLKSVWQGHSMTRNDFR